MGDANIVTLKEGLMSKVLTDTEVLEIVERAIRFNEIDDSDQYLHFLEALGELVADHFGGELVCVSNPLMEDEAPEESLSATRWCLHFRWNECVPEDGGVYKKYDTDITMEDWKEGA